MSKRTGLGRGLGAFFGNEMCIRDRSKMLNQSKGPAVHSLRAQADKQEYTRQMRRTMENTDHLTIRQAFLSLETKWTEKEIGFQVELEEVKYTGNEGLFMHKMCIRDRKITVK